MVGILGASLFSVAQARAQPIVETPTVAAESVAIPSASCPDLASYTAQISQLNAALLERDATIGALQGKLAKGDDQVQQLEARLRETVDNNERLLDEKAQGDAERLRLAMSLSVAQSEAQKTQEALTRNAEDIRRASRASASDRAKLENTRAELEKALRKKGTEVTALQGQLKGQETKLADTAKELAEINANRTSQEKEFGERSRALALEESAQQHKTAFVTMAVIGSTIALPLLLLLVYLLYSGSQRRHEQEELHKRFVGAALALRTQDGQQDLSAIEHTLVGDLSGNRMLVLKLRQALRAAMLLSLVGAVTLSITAMVSLQGAVIGDEHIELIKSSAWKGLLGLFTPIGALVTCATLVQTKYRDAVSHCLEAGLIAAPRRLSEDDSKPASGLDQKRVA